MNLRILILSAALLILPGCLLWPKKDIDGGASKPGTSLNVDSASKNVRQANVAAANAQKTLDSAKGESDQKTDELLAKTKANIITARENNRGNPDGNPKEKTEQELSIADARLDKVKADEDELEEGRKRNTLIDQGRIQEARTATQIAIDSAKADAVALAEAKTHIESLTKERDEAVQKKNSADAELTKAVNEYQKKAEQNKKDYDARLEEAQQAMMKEQARGLNIGGFICMLLFGAGLAFGGLPGLQKTWFFGVLAVICFGLAQIISQPWFMWACLIALIVVVGLAIFFLIRRHQLDAKQSEANVQANRLNEILATVVPVLDEAYEKGTEAEKKILDEKVFTPLGKAMNREEKAIVHLIRADTSASAS